MLKRQEMESISMYRVDPVYDLCEMVIFITAI